MQLIVRKEYLNELIELYGTPDIKVITGIRRSGKSVLLQEFVSYLQSLEETVNIVMINLQELEFDHLLEYHALHKYILDQYKEGMTDRYDEAFGRYVRTGGMPGSYVYKTEDRQYDYKGVQVVDICRWLRE